MLKIFANNPILILRRLKPKKRMYLTDIFEVIYKTNLYMVDEETLRSNEEEQLDLISRETIMAWVRRGCYEIYDC